MPLILLTGYPSSGLTYRAQQLISHFTAHPPSAAPNFSIQHISDDTLSISRSAYDAARSEKDARATLSSAIKRHLGRETLVIADAMNYIKGFRYQMWCEAKAAGTGCCVLHVAASPEQAKSQHDRRRPSGDLQTEIEQPVSQHQQPPAYMDSTFENLISRYEEPSASARWDSPLFTVPYSDSDPPYDAIALALFGNAGKISSTKKGNSVTSLASTSRAITLQSLEGLNGSKVSMDHPNTTSSEMSDKIEPAAKTGKFVKPHLATVAPRQMSADALYVLEKTTSDIVKSILQYTTAAGISECAGETMDLSRSQSSYQASDDQEAENGEEKLTITLPTTGTLSVAHLQRLKRQFVSLYRSRGVGMGAASSGGTGGLPGGELGAYNVSRAFVKFLQSSFDGESD